MHGWMWSTRCWSSGSRMRVRRRRRSPGRGGSLPRSGGNASIGGLAARIGWSRKHFISKFREHVGLTPKTAGRVLRFNRALRLLDRGAEASWASIAMMCGYYDQAHLIRDFNEFAGAPPLEFMSRLLPHGEYRAG